MLDPKALTPTEIRLENTKTIGTPPFNWLPPESPPIDVTSNQRNSYSKTTDQIEASRKQLRRMIPRGGRAQNNLTNGTLPHIPDPREDFEHPDPPLDDEEVNQIRSLLANPNLAKADPPTSRLKELVYKRPKTGSVAGAASAGGKARRSPVFDVAKATQLVESFERLRITFDWIVARAYELCLELNLSIHLHASALLSVKDIVNLDELVNQLLSAAAGSPIANLWHLIPAQTKALIRHQANLRTQQGQLPTGGTIPYLQGTSSFGQKNKGGTVVPASPEEHKSALVVALNDILRGPGIIGGKAPDHASQVLFHNRLQLERIFGSNLIKRYELPKEFKPPKKIKPYHEARYEYIAFVQNLSNHEPKPAEINPARTFGYGKNLGWMFLDPIIVYDPVYRLNLITGLTIIGEWIGTHCSSNGVPIPHSS